MHLSFGYLQKNIRCESRALQPRLASDAVDDQESLPTEGRFLRPPFSLAVNRADPRHLTPGARLRMFPLNIHPTLRNNRQQNRENRHNHNIRNNLQIPYRRHN